MKKAPLFLVLIVSLAGSPAALRAASAPRTPPPAPKSPTTPSSTTSKSSPTTPTTAAKGATSTTTTSNSKSTTDNWERIETKVLKVFSAKDGDNVYRSYLVQWNGQDVVVEDRLARTNFQAGETIAVLVTRNSFPDGKENRGLLQFSVMPPINSK